MIGWSVSERGGTKVEPNRAKTKEFSQKLKTPLKKILTSLGGNFKSFFYYFRHAESNEPKIFEIDRAVCPEPLMYSASAIGIIKSERVGVCRHTSFNGVRLASPDVRHFWVSLRSAACLNVQQRPSQLPPMCCKYNVTNKK